MSRNTEDLHPEIRWRAKEIAARTADLKIPILIYFTLRTFAEQQVLYDQGRSLPGHIVTNAKAGESYHNYGLAFDFAILEPNQEIAWNTGVDINDNKIPDYREVGELGEDLGLQWGGRFKNLKGDYGHLQLDFGFNIPDLQKLYVIGGLPRVWQAIDEKIRNPRNRA